MARLIFSGANAIWIPVGACGGLQAGYHSGYRQSRSHDEGFLVTHPEKLLHLWCYHTRKLPHSPINGVHTHWYPTTRTVAMCCYNIMTSRIHFSITHLIGSVLISNIATVAHTMPMERGGCIQYVYSTYTSAVHSLPAPALMLLSFIRHTSSQ